MMSRKTVRVSVCSVLLIMGCWSRATDASAQSALGGGPLTSTLVDVEPVTGVLTLGLVKAAPGLAVQQIGWDDNVFDELDSAPPKEDFVVEVKPDVSLFSRLRFVRFSAYAGSGMTYFQKYASERTIGYDARGRVDFLLSRVRPFLGYGATRTRTRPNGEIDVRVTRVDEEASGGVAFDLSPQAAVYAAAYQMRSEFDDAHEDGINIGDTLTRDSYNYESGLKTDLTPLLSVQLFGAYREERFPSDAARNSLGKSLSASFRFAPDAVVTGVVSGGFHDIHYSDPAVKPFRGFVGSAALTYPFLEIGRFAVLARRGVEYSYDTAEAYYVENTGSLSYTHRLFGEVDVQGKLMRSLFDYDARATQPPHQDTLDLAGGSLGYNLRNRTRIALNYEYARRRSPAFEARNYQRRRVFISWLFGF